MTTDSASRFYYVTKLMDVMDGNPQVRELKGALVQDPEKETINILHSKEALESLIGLHGIEHYRAARMAIRNVVNFLYFSGMVDFYYAMAGKHKYTQENAIMITWWWENVYRFKKTLLVGAFLEGRNLEHIGASILRRKDIPQAFIAMATFIRLFQENTVATALMAEEHLANCDQCKDIVSFYGVNEPLGE